MSATGSTVFLLDDEPGMLKAFMRHLKAKGFAAMRPCATGDEMTLAS
jgi:hypothetical protein